MFKRPTSRRKTHSKQVQLNLVPILDTMVTLIAFLLFTMSFLEVVSIETPIPTAAADSTAQQLKEKPLQLTLSLGAQQIELWSPFNLIPKRSIPHSAPNQPDLKAIHAALIEIKQKFPTERVLVLVPAASTNYDTLVAVMDSARVLEKTDPSIYFKDPASGREELVKGLFPDVVLGNLLGGD